MQPSITRRRLVTPWPKLKLDIPQAYYLLYRPQDRERPELVAFRSWLLGLLRSERVIG